MQSWEKKLKITKTQAGQSIKQLLINLKLPKRIRGQLRQARRILLNGHYQPTSTILASGDILVLTFVASDFITAESSYLPDEARHPQIIFENDDLLVVNKFRDVKTHPNAPDEQGTMLNYVQAYLMQKSTTDRAYMVHRLDAATTGALVIAKNPIVVPILTDQLRHKTLGRTYLAWVSGVLTEQAGEITLPIGLDPNNPRLRQVAGLDAQTALTHWVKIHQVTNYSLVRIQLATGRTHQIRVHFAAIGHPLVGDTLYNPASPKGAALLLHAAAISLQIPFSNEEKTIGVPLPQDFPRNLGPV